MSKSQMFRHAVQAQCPAHHKPFHLVDLLTKLAADTVEVSTIAETMSFPTPEGTIMVRTVPGDPTTLQEVALERVRDLREHTPKYVSYARVFPPQPLVEGRTRGTFPIDMLRYDRATPVNFKLVPSNLTREEDGYFQQAELTTKDLGPDLIVATTTRTIKEAAFTYARWQSFGWTCIVVRIEPIRKIAQELTMPRVHFVAKAAKDNSVCKKGQSYYWWEFRYGGKRMSKTPPRPSQLTQSKMSGAYAAQEALEDALESAAKSAEDPSDITSAIEEAVQAIRDVAQEYEDAIDAMPESLQDSARDGEMGEKVSGLNDWADALESDVGEVDNVALEDFWLADNHGGAEAPDPFEFSMFTEEEQQAVREAWIEAVSNVECPL